MPAAVDIDKLNESQLRALIAQMQQALGEKETRLQERDSTIHRLTIEKDHLTHEIAWS